MSVSLYFGLPGAGKTTLMASHAIKGIKSKKYEHVYGNVHMSIDGYTYIDNDCIGKFNLENCLILIDEATLFADSRRYKEFDMGKITYFLEHRHFNADIKLYTQQWDGVDRKIRVITDRVYYVFKGRLFGKWFTKYYRIPYGIIIPDPHKDKSSEKLGEIVQGYCKPNIIMRLFAHRLYRPKYYKYYDSWERPDLPKLPPKYKAYQSEEVKKVDLFEACSDRWKSLTPEQRKALNDEIERQDNRLNLRKSRQNVSEVLSDQKQSECSDRT